MSSVRSRAEIAAFEREQQRQEAVVPVKSRSTLVAVNGPSASTRERTAAAEFTESETLRPPPKKVGLTQHVEYVGSTRARLDRQCAAEGAKSERPTRTANAQYWMDEYEREQATKKQRVLDNQKLQRERERKIKEQEQQNLRNWNINLAFSQAPGGPPTADERQRVLSALQKFPDANPAEKAVSILLTLRGDLK